MSYDISRRSFLLGGSVAATAALASFYVGQVEELGKLILREPTDYDRVLYADESRGFLLILDTRSSAGPSYGLPGQPETPSSAAHKVGRFYAATVVYFCSGQWCFFTPALTVDLLAQGGKYADMWVRQQAAAEAQRRLEAVSEVI